jgi:hypothetical protein
VRRNDFGSLDKCYFDWEDSLQSVAHDIDGSFQLLSGFSFDPLRRLPLRLAIEGIRSSVYEVFLERAVVDVAARSPSLICVSISSAQQILPAIELLRLIRIIAPKAFTLLGGNVVTRLRNTEAMSVFTAHADVVCLFQGELAVARITDYIAHHGVASARCHIPKIVGDEKIPTADWRQPSFSGIDLHSFPGVPALPFVTTRGCYWGRCSFCAIPAGWSSSGYAGSLNGVTAAGQIEDMARMYDIRNIKIVDEAFPPSKVSSLASALESGGLGIQWEVYARLDSNWADEDLLLTAARGGLRKIYFGLEQAPSSSRSVFGKNDRADPRTLTSRAAAAGIKVHMFCMVGHPETSRDDALRTVEFLLENQSEIDTADLVGFRLDRGTEVRGTKQLGSESDWSLRVSYVPESASTLTESEVKDLEIECQEIIWDEAPRLLHPLYRLLSPWTTKDLGGAKPDAALSPAVTAGRW